LQSPGSIEEHRESRQRRDKGHRGPFLWFVSLGKQRNEQSDFLPHSPISTMLPKQEYTIATKPQMAIPVTHRRQAKNMKLFVTPKGDRWLCSECEEDFAETITKEGWRIAFTKIDPMLRCSECKHGDIEIFD
jgi:hypothetical protein